MADCDICNILKNKEAFKMIYEDEHCFAILHESPAIPGHSLIIPKKHASIIEEFEDKEAAHLFIAANKVSTALFDALGAHGTNILLNNGTDAGQELPHLVLNVLPRKENDSLNLEWQPKQATDTELKTTQSMIRTFSEAILSGRDRLPDVKVRQPEQKKPKHDEEEDYLIKSLKRIP